MWRKSTPINYKIEIRIFFQLDVNTSFLIFQLFTDNNEMITIYNLALHINFSWFWRRLFTVLYDIFVNTRNYYSIQLRKTIL